MSDRRVMGRVDAGAPGHPGLPLGELAPAASTHVAVIRSTEGWPLPRLRELWEYHDLLYFLVWRDIKARYAQSVLGIGWAIIQPLFSMIVFTVVFGKLAHVPSDGVPYAMFSYAALVPWTYFASALTEGSNSLVSASAMIRKVYLPRLAIPLAPVISKQVDFLIGLALLAGIMIYFGMTPTAWVLVLPLLVLLLMLTAFGLALWLAALSVQYRDIHYALGFIVQLLMYATPVVYPASLIPDRFLLLYSLNPLVGVIEGFRAALLGTRSMPWDLLAVGTASALITAATGSVYFRRVERVLCDVI